MIIHSAKKTTQEKKTLRMKVGCDRERGLDKTLKAGVGTIGALHKAGGLRTLCKLCVIKSCSGKRVI